ncbi:MAG TPA: NAD(P)/FAD-dependent oxidoreductase [Patescibacteria group bacterium]|nr:NAD(P)/FAD-dependent oxidoreductase [Patescibacteria group bacterium]
MPVRKIAVVGAGPAGMMAAIRAGQLGQTVSLFEKNNHPGKKLLLCGKGRCNLTNACGLEDFLERFCGNGQFLRDAFKKFFNRELIRFFEDNGLKLKVERQLRVFPVTDRSASILEVLKKQLAARNVTLICSAPVEKILVDAGAVSGLALKDGQSIPADRVILATGGVSYSFTGSDGGGLQIARTLGHRVTALRAGLVGLQTQEDYPRKLEGLALKNIRLAFDDGKRRIVSEIGEMLFTAFGVSGPLVLTLSGKISDWLQEGRRVGMEIDLKPALSEEQLHDRLLREFKANPRRGIRTILKALLPLRLIDIFIQLAKFDPDKRASYISLDERQRIVALLKHFRLQISQPRPIEEAMITRGGVSLKEIDPRTMESRLVKGLYFAGEIIDVDADTGGFNLQAAFSTGYLAGESAALR